MDFLLDSTHTDLAQAVTQITTRAGGTDVARAWSEGDRTAGLGVYARLAEAGITGLLVGDELGGSGAGPVEMMVAVEQLGRCALPGPVAETFAVVPALLGAAGAVDALAPLLAGERAGSCAVPPVTPRAADPEVADVYLLTGGVLSRGSAGTPLDTVDPTRQVADVTAGEVLAEGVDAVAAIDLGALATAAQSLGLAAAMLDLAADYAKTRHQFGKAIGSFQAVKHHLADVAIAVEMARPLVWGAAVALENEPHSDTATRDVSAAKVAAAEAADVAARRALQVLGAIGYTAEHDFSLLLTKARALRSAWGTPDWHRQRILETLRTEAGTR
ncbi:acyl-CoA dehydrogenase family protein [Gordonia caeni]|uniref:Acyl-CoA dehydrogenase n=1 Tax=Gordonia caeni TaxID=1007097 RepID=A0ABP7NX14_9ACTN